LGCDNRSSSRSAPLANTQIKHNSEGETKRILVRVDIKVGIDGYPVVVVLSENNPEKEGIFVEQALLKAKTIQFPKKSENGRAIEYWKREVLIEAGQVKPARTPYKLSD
jgi:hypothetical protein